MSDRSAWILVAIAALLTCAGCRRPQNPTEPHVAALEQVFPGLAATNAPVELTAAGGDPKTYVRAAIQAQRQDDLAAAAILLDRAVRSPGMSPAQLAAVQAARSAWVQALAARAERGEERAKAGLATLNNR